MINWKIVLILSSFGIVMALLSVFGNVKGSYELVLWALLAIVSSYMIAKKGGRLPFIEGVTTGVLSGILNSAVQFFFFRQYILNNPGKLEQFREIPLEMPAQYLILFTGPIIGLIYGIILGIISTSFRKVIETND